MIIQSTWRPLFRRSLWRVNSIGLGGGGVIRFRTMIDQRDSRQAFIVASIGQFHKLFSFFNRVTVPRKVFLNTFLCSSKHTEKKQEKWCPCLWWIFYFLPRTLVFEYNVSIEFLMCSLLIFVSLVFNSRNHGSKQVFEVGVQPAVEDGVGKGA